MNKYAVFSYVKNHVHNHTVPVGVVAWSPELAWHQTRFMKSEEQLPGLQSAEYLPFIRLIQDKLEHWEKTTRLPYCTEELQPHQEAWWTHVRKLLNHEICLSEPALFDSATPRESLESLYLSVIAPCWNGKGPAEALQPYSGEVLA
jgi:hypothetical protein